MLENVHFILAHKGRLYTKVLYQSGSDSGQRAPSPSKEETTALTQISSIPLGRRIPRFPSFTLKEAALKITNLRLKSELHIALK